MRLKLIVTNFDKDTLVTNVTDFILTKLGNADADDFLDSGEVFSIAVNTSTCGLVGGQQFSLEVKPSMGPVITLTRQIPGAVEQVMVLA